jgi:hypothetical protein
MEWKGLLVFKPWSLCERMVERVRVESAGHPASASQLHTTSYVRPT